MTQPETDALDPAEVFYFSEGGEDFFLWTLFGYPRRGVYIDVGAFDGRYLSNSYSFARAGWRGLCVEPVAEYFERCRENQPQAVCVNAACVADPEQQFVTFNAEPLGVYSRITVSGDDKARLRESYERYGLETGEFTENQVPATTLKALIGAHFPNDRIDVLSIDVEGGEIDVLEGLDIDNNRPHVIVAEANTQESLERLTAWFASNRYRYMRTVSNNHFYSEDDALVEKAKSIRIKCAIERHRHPKGLAYTFRGIALGKIIDEETEAELGNQRWRLREAEKSAARLINVETRLEQVSKALATMRDDHTLLQRTETGLRQRIKQLETILQEVREQRGRLTVERDSLLERLSCLESVYKSEQAKLKIAEETIAANFLIWRPRFLRKK